MSAPLLVATVAAPTMAELCRRRDGVTGADLIDLRLDSVADLDVTAALAGRRLPVVAVCRPKWEGGSFSGSESERRRVLECAMEHGAEYVDVEFEADFARELISRTQGKGIVLSSHDFDRVPSDLAERVRAMRDTGAEIVKLAVMPQSLSDNLRLLNVQRSRNTVVIGMGPAGMPTRVLAARFGSCWSYAGDGYAPGQIPLARMLDEFRFRSLSGSSAIYGIVGSPLTHSLSPAMHNAVFAAAGVDAVYVPLVASSAADFLEFADALDVKGVSITLPYKVDLFQRADIADELSTQVGAVNTYRRQGSRWEARNTDVSGFLSPLKGRMELRGARAAIIGAGGSARAVAAALGSTGSTVTVYARDKVKADAVARIAHGRGAFLPVVPKSWDLLVNTTPVGMYPNVDDTSFHGPFDGDVVYDLVYNPTETQFLRDARAAGCTTIGGLDMLVAQAEEQSEWWLGRRPPKNLMREVASSALDAARRAVKV